MAKKLKRITSEVASYIIINGQAAKDHNDRMLAVSYGHTKLEMIDWYIALLDSGSKKYVVPQTREQLLAVKEKIEDAIDEVLYGDNIERIPIGPPSSGGIDYPEGYDG
jgi:hypothetical protein